MSLVSKAQHLPRNGAELGVRGKDQDSEAVG
jgi:hypothetical protein